MHWIHYLRRGGASMEYFTLALRDFLVRPSKATFCFELTRLKLHFYSTLIHYFAR